MGIHDASGEIELVRMRLALFEQPPPLGGFDYPSIAVVVRCEERQTPTRMWRANYGVLFHEARSTGQEFMRLAQLGLSPPRTGAMHRRP